jgi:nucleotide-binding universal stress UspA family protein
VLVEHRVAEGDPAEEVLRLAEREGCDLIVMATRGRTGLGRLWLGSVAEEVVRNAACPVVTARKGAAGPARGRRGEAEALLGERP